MTMINLKYRHILDFIDGLLENRSRENIFNFQNDLLKVIKTYIKEVKTSSAPMDPPTRVIREAAPKCMWEYCEKFMENISNENIFKINLAIVVRSFDDKKLNLHHSQKFHFMVSINHLIIIIEYEIPKIITESLQVIEYYYILSKRSVYVIFLVPL